MNVMGDGVAQTRNFGLLSVLRLDRTTTVLLVTLLYCCRQLSYQTYR